MRVTRVAQVARVGQVIRVALVATVAAVGVSRAIVVASDDAKGAAVPQSFYELNTTKLSGEAIELKEYEGKVALVVNTASKCGYTPQYEGLESLQREMKGKDFNVLGFPSNDFGGQEPGSAQEIASFCKLTYGVTFPMFEKVVTRKGGAQSPVYAFLGRSGNLPAWNFSKYVVDKQGRVVAFFPSEVRPEDPKLRAAIAKALSGS